MREKIWFKQSLFIAGVILEVVLFGFSFVSESSISTGFILTYFFVLFLILWPFTDSVIYQKVGMESGEIVRRFRKTALSWIEYDHITSVKHHSFLSFFPKVIIEVKGNRHISLPLSISGVFDLEQRLIAKGDLPLTLFLRYHRELEKQEKSLYKTGAHIVWWMLLFSVVTPLLIWDGSFLLTLVWLFISIVVIMVVVSAMSILNRVALHLLPLWGRKYLATVRVWMIWVLFMAFLWYGTVRLPFELG